MVHAVAGPLDARQFLREAKWASEVRKLAMTEAAGESARYRATIRKAHLERLTSEQGVPLQPNALPRIAAGAPPTPTVNTLRLPAARRVGAQGQVHVLLAYYPLPKLAQLYPIVFEFLQGLQPGHLIGEGRVYGGGLHKLEPNELASLPAHSLAEAIGVRPLPVERPLLKKRSAGTGFASAGGAASASVDSMADTSCSPFSG